MKSFANGFAKAKERRPEGPSSYPHQAPYGRLPRRLRVHGHDWPELSAKAQKIAHAISLSERLTMTIDVQTPTGSQRFEGTGWEVDPAGHLSVLGRPGTGVVATIHRDHWVGVSRVKDPA